MGVMFSSSQESPSRLALVPGTWGCPAPYCSLWGVSKAEEIPRETRGLGSLIGLLGE